MKRITALSLIALAVLVSPALADFYIAPGGSEGKTLTWSLAEDELTVQHKQGASNTWEDTRTQFTYLVTRPEAGPYTYTYTFTAPDPGLSHLDIQVSADRTASGGLPAFSLDNLMDFASTQVSGIEMVGQGQQPVWWDDDTMEAIRFQGDSLDKTVVAEGLYTWTVEFESYRNPMWGNIYAKGGQETAWNTALGTVLVPNSSYVVPVPIPGAVLLGMLGLGAAGMRLRRTV